MITCKTHPRYRGIRRSTTNCTKCKIIRGLHRIAAACGLPVAQAVPRKTKTRIPSAYGEPTRDYTFVGGPADGRTVNLPTDATEHIHTERSSSESECYLYVKCFNEVGAPVFRLGSINDGVTNYDKAEHDFGKPLPEYESFLFLGGTANLQRRPVEVSNGGVYELTVLGNLYIYRRKVIDWTSNPYPIAYVLDGMSDWEVQQQLEAYRSLEELPPADSGGKTC